MINSFFNFCFLCLRDRCAQLRIASDVVNIFIPQDAYPCQEKILYLQREDPIFTACKGI